MNIFIQYLNPEILLLYGHNINDPRYQKFLLKKTLEMTKIASLIIEDDKFFFPGSYTLEVNFFDKFLNDLKFLIADGLFSYITPIADKEKYNVKKQTQYKNRSQYVVSNFSYEDYNGLIWTPRKKRSSSKDIRNDWEKGIANEEKVFKDIFERLAANKQWKEYYEKEMYNIPDKIEDNAFIFEFVNALLPVELKNSEEYKIALLLSNSYLCSYLDECNSIILSDTPLGDLHCDVPEFSNDGKRLTFSYKKFVTYLRYFTIYDDILNLGKKDLSRLRNNYAFREVIKYIIELMDSEVIPKDLLHLLERYIVKKEFLLDQIVEKCLYVDAHKNPIMEKERGNMDARKVFIVHGRDTYIKQETEKFLLDLDLKPVYWNEAKYACGTATPYNLEVVKKGLELAQAIVILLTPDEKSELKKELTYKEEEDGVVHYQSRPNVLIELGMALAIDEKRTIVVKFGNSYIPTDIAGKNVIRFDASISARTTFAQSLESAGCAVDTRNNNHLIRSFETFESWK